MHGDDAGACGNLKNAGRLEKRRTLGDELRIGLKQQWAYVAVVKGGSRMLEGVRLSQGKASCVAVSRPTCGMTLNMTDRAAEREAIVKRHFDREAHISTPSASSWAADAQDLKQVTRSSTARDVALDMVACRTFDGRLQLLEYLPTVLAGPPGADPGS